MNTQDSGAGPKNISEILIQSLLSPLERSVSATHKISLDLAGSGYPKAHQDQYGHGRPVLYHLSALVTAPRARWGRIDTGKTRLRRDTVSLY